MANDLIRRLRLASSQALSGKTASSERRTDIPAITEDEVAEAKRSFPRKNISSLDTLVPGRLC